ncbi:MAG TPA: translocation/assembly module TamB domain-containing protein, partial [Bacteroidales bacterium]|nr:translocation/assembly module TamB domain-containing protein [Bacteroidales bacterium]
ITIPLNNTITVTDNDFVVFKKDEPYEKKDYIEDYSVDIKGLYLNFRVEVTNVAEVMIYLPSDMGNISSKGFGDIRFTINPRGEFQIFGDYNFLRGTFFFTLQNLINRRFEILQGGNISFTGNPYNSDLSLKALYRLKTSLSGLGATISPEYAGQRVNVNAYLGLRGKLANPEIRFSIGFPNVRTEIKQTIYAVLDTTDVALMNQQMLSLLVMNSFSYASGSANLPASSLNIISSQLSNWLSQISNDFDIGINYIAGDEINQDELEVALSTQFFDNRLIVDGNVGVMTKDNTQQQASNIVGDVNIEYKLRPDGRIRLRAFNRSNNINTIDYYAPYTQGIGIFYTKEFDRFGDIFKRQRKIYNNGQDIEQL